MKVKAGRAVALTTGFLVAISLTGCVPSEDPNAWRTATPTATSSPTPTAAPTTPPTPPAGAQATSESEAVEQASQAAQRYLDANFTMLSTPGLGADYLTALLVPGSPMVKQAQLTAESGDRMEGAPVKWTTNAAMSTVGPIKDGTGATAQYGNVELYGCVDASQMTYYGADGKEVTRDSDVAPALWSVYFDPTSGTWLIYQLKTLVNRDGTVVEGAPQC